MKIFVVELYENDRGGKYCYNTIYVRAELDKIQRLFEQLGYKRCSKVYANGIVMEKSSTSFSVKIEEFYLYSVAKLKSIMKA